MPAFYQAPMASQMPLTPPDSGSGYGYRSMQYPSDPYASHQSMSQHRQDSAYDYQQSYIPPAVPQAPSTYQYSQSNYQGTSLPPIQSYYEPMGAPILPPLRINEGLPFGEDYRRRLQQEQQNTTAREQQRPPAKEEKATGGVSAKLDYDMECMTDFVTQATQSIFHHNMQSQPSFRKWVHQVLSATRLPSATILLSLHYLNDRVANFPETIAPGENQIYRLLAVSLILGSKFLDDNTFVNRSWSDVTAIKVTELNLLEMNWLKLINYELHIDADAPGGIQAWLDAWAAHEAKYHVKQQQTSRLSPLDTNVYRHASTHERYSPYPTPYTAASSRSFDGLHSSRSSQYTTPYLASDPWGPRDHHAFDDFYKRQHRYPNLTEFDEVNRRASEERARQSSYSYTLPQNPHSSYYSTPTYASAWDQHSWNGMHRHDCNCTSCSYRHYRPYPMASGYIAQTVMG